MNMSIFVSLLAKFLHYFWPVTLRHCPANFPAVPSVLNTRKLVCTVYLENFSVWLAPGTSCISGEPGGWAIVAILPSEDTVRSLRSRFNSMAKFSPTKLSQTEFLTNQGINSYLFTEGALDFSPTKRNLLLILEISHQPVGENCHTI